MDCSTWFLVENQSKMVYPLPPRFFSYAGLFVVFCVGFAVEFSRVFVFFSCWNFQGSAVGVDSGVDFGVGTGRSCVLREVLDEKRVVVWGLAR